MDCNNRPSGNRLNLNRRMLKLSCLLRTKESNVYFRRKGKENLYVLNDNKSRLLVKMFHKNKKHLPMSEVNIKNQISLPLLLCHQELLAI